MGWLSVSSMLITSCRLVWNSSMPGREFSAAEVKRLRERLKFSEPVFAHLLHTPASTVRKWEQG